MKFRTNDDIKNAIYDGMFANIFATLTGGVFLTGFGLFLGMNEFMIGILASMPFLVTVFQLPASYLIEKKGNRKKVSTWAAAAARLSWIPILTVALLPISNGSIKALIILAMIFLSYAFISISYVSWLSWISDLVPDGMRGRFFGKRNMLCGAAGMIVMVAFGNLIDFLKNSLNWGLSLGFSVTFMTAVSCGILSLRYLIRISEPTVKDSKGDMPFLGRLSLPLKNANFRRFATFSLFWGFSVYFASPFITVYFLRELKFSYGFAAALGMISAFADMIGMGFWGKISDRVKNRPVIRFAGWFAAFLPLAWIMVRPGNIIMPLILNLVGGGFWAGINLCTNNMLMRISPPDNRAFFLSVYHVLAGLGAATGPIVGGFILSYMNHSDLTFLTFKVIPLHIIFAISTLLRLITLQLLRYVREPEEVTVGQMIRIIRSVRGLNTSNGFNYLIHPFMELSEKKDDPPA